MHFAHLNINLENEDNPLEWKVEVFCSCPRSSCKRSFISYYNKDTNFDKYVFNGETSLGIIQSKEFDETIEGISSDFVEIYNEAYKAEHQDLKEICGVGYRKALEFLIKDYIISNGEDEETIKNTPLGQCIQNYVNDGRIKKAAKRAVWLGNDETHYVRKWEGKNLEDLKSLIDLTIHWIEMEKITNSLDEDMPES